MPTNHERHTGPGGSTSSSGSQGADAADDGLNEGLSSSLTKGLTDVFGLRGYAVGYVVQQAAALCTQVRDLDATCDSDPSFSWNVIGPPPAGDRRLHRAPSNRAGLEARP